MGAAEISTSPSPAGHRRDKSWTCGSSLEGADRHSAGVESGSEKTDPSQSSGVHRSVWRTQRSALASMRSRSIPGRLLWPPPSSPIDRRAPDAYRLGSTSPHSTRTHRYHR
jgi:hypothetical protein